MPEGWDSRHWLAAQMIGNGATLQKVGEHFGLQRSTISGWVHRWRKVHGSEFLRRGRDQRAVSRSPSKGLRAVGDETQQRWEDLRQAAALDSAVTAAAARELARKVIASYADDPVRLKSLTPSDVTQLVNSANKLDARADKLAGIRDVDKVSTARGLPAGPGTAGDPGGVPEGLLAGLEAGPGDEEEEVLDMVESIRDAFLRQVSLADPPEGSIEVDGREVS